MKLLKRLMFALQYDIDRDFIVYSTLDRPAMQFTEYKDAKKFSDEQIQFRPKVLVSVKRKGDKPK